MTVTGPCSVSGNATLIVGASTSDTQSLQAVRYDTWSSLCPPPSLGVVWNWNAPGGVTRTDSWREQTMAAGDVWVIDGLTCQWSGRDLVCS